MRRHAGFTLVELSIVLVLIGLIVGGVVAGKALIKRQQVLSVATEGTGYLAAARQFYQKYQEMPGDFSRATAVWGRADGVAGTANCASPNTNASPAGGGTCNGDGNGSVELSNSAGNVENYWYWQHLSAAGMISGKFSGIPDASDNQFPVIGVNTPATSLNEATYIVNSFGVIVGGGNAGKFDGDYTNALVAVVPSTTVTTPFESNYGPFKASEASSIDTKFDDGRPDTGTIRTWKSPNAPGVGGCTGLSGGVYSYNKRLNTFFSSFCPLIFMNAFRADQTGLQ